MTTIELYQLNLSTNKIILLDQITARSNLQWFTSKNAIGQCSFDLDAVDTKANINNLYRFRTLVVIKDNNIIRWFGPITKITGGYSRATSKITVMCNTYLFYFSKRLTSKFDNISANNTDVGQIMWNLITYSQNLSNGNLFITQGITQTSINQTITYQRQIIQTAITDLSNLINGPSFNFDALTDSNGHFSGVIFNVYGGLGVSRTDLPPLELGKNVQGITFSTQNDIYNSVFGEGSGSGTDILSDYQEDNFSQIAFLRSEYFNPQKSISINQNLIDNDLMFLNNNKGDIYDINVEIIPNSNPNYGDFQIGDYLSLNLYKSGTLIDFRGVYQIKEINVQCSNNDTKTITLKFRITK